MAEKLGDDLRIGAKAIAEEMGMTERQLRHAAETGQLPIFRLGGKLTARCSSLRQRLAQLESEAA